MAPSQEVVNTIEAWEKSTLVDPNTVDLDEWIKTLEDPIDVNIVNILNGWNFDYDYLMNNKKQVVEIIMNNDTSDVVRNNIKWVIAWKVNDYLGKYGAYVEFNQKNNPENFHMAAGRDGSSLFIYTPDIQQPKDLQSIVGFSWLKFNVFALDEYTPFIVHMWDEVVYNDGYGGGNRTWILTWINNWNMVNIRDKQFNEEIYDDYDAYKIAGPVIKK